MKPKTTINKTKENAELKLLEDIKKLIILQLLRDGAPTKEIGNVLGVSYKTIQRAVPFERFKNKK